MSQEISIEKNGCGLTTKTIVLLGLIFCLTLLGTSRSQAQMVNQPWGFAQQNRASIAALIKQTEDRNETQSVTASAGGYDQLVCGKDGDSSATGNNTCIIMNNSDGVIQIGQDAQGNQTATSSTETKETESISDALDKISAANP